MSSINLQTIHREAVEMIRGNGVFGFNKNIGAMFDEATDSFIVAVHRRSVKGGNNGHSEMRIRGIVERFRGWLFSERQFCGLCRDAARTVDEVSLVDTGVLSKGHFNLGNNNAALIEAATISLIRQGVDGSIFNHIEAIGPGLFRLRKTAN